MIRIVFRTNRFREIPRLMERPSNFFRRKSTEKDKDKEKEKDKDKDKDKDNNEQALQEPIIRKGVLNEKRQSLQEESFFLREERQQLKELKKKFNENKTNDEKKKD